MSADLDNLKPCPVCNGDGYIVEAECCNRFHENETCCGDPNPVQVECERCMATGYILITEDK
jgi:hypothetical protein